MKLTDFTNTFTQTLYPEGARFFTPNGCTGERKKQNLTHVNAVFADWDFKPVEDADGNPIEPTGARKPDFKQFMLDLDGLPTPTYIVESGNGWHLYWMLEESIVVDDSNRQQMIDDVEGIHRYIHTHYNSDGGAMDVLRLMRQPGYDHKKQPEHPFRVTVLSEDEDARYTLDELKELMPPIYEEKITYENEVSDDYDIKQVAIDVWKEKGDEVTFDSIGRMIWNGKKTATFIGREGSGNYIATTSDDFPYKGNSTTYVSGVLGISTKEAYQWLVAKYGKRELPTLGVVNQEEDDDLIDFNKLMTVVKNAGKSNEMEVIVPNDENIIRILTHHKVAKYDSFKAKAYLKINGKWVPRDDGADGLLYSWLVNKYKFLAMVTSKKVADLITPVQYRFAFDSAQDYINGLTWDGEKRLDLWLHKVFFVGENDTYYHEIASKWWMGLVARILDPGVKFEGVLLLQGGQGVGKSSVFMIIADGSYTQTGPESNHVEFTDLRVKEMQQDMQGTMVVEFAEGAIFTKSDSETVKSIVSRTNDKYRIPYERNARDFPRRCVFAVTANHTEILKDDTGGRRWWNVELPDDLQGVPPKKKADIQWLQDNRDQLFAEAAVRYRNGEEFRKVDEYEQLRRQKSITATETDEDLFYKWYHGLTADRQNYGVTVREAYCQVYGEDNNVKIVKTDEMRVTRILKRIGLEKKKMTSHNVWVPGEHFERDYDAKFTPTIHEKW